MDAPPVQIIVNVYCREGSGRPATSIVPFGPLPGDPQPQPGALSFRDLVITVSPTVRERSRSRERTRPAAVDEATRREPETSTG